MEDQRADSDEHRRVLDETFGSIPDLEVPPRSDWDRTSVAQRASDCSAVSASANAAINRAQACTSSSWTISTGECM